MNTQNHFPPLPQLLKFLALIMIPAVSVLLLIVAARQIMGVDMYTMTRDMTAVAGLHPLTGVLSNLGILVWCATASICLFAALCFRKRGYPTIHRFFIFSFALAAYLLLDDLFLIHEVIGPEYMGISEKAIYAGIAGYTLCYLIMFRKIILGTNFLVLLLAFSFMGLSVVSDVLLSPRMETSQAMVELSYFLEDGFKWLGIFVFCAYYFQTALRFLTQEELLPAAEAREANPDFPPSEPLTDN